MDKKIESILNKLDHDEKAYIEQVINLSSLNEIEKIHHYIIENSPICTKIISLDCKLKYMSLAGIKGLKISDITDFYDKPYPPENFPEDMKKHYKEKVPKCIAGERVEFECQIPDTEGNLEWYLTTLTPGYGESGNVEFIIASSSCIGDRKRMEDEVINKRKLESVGFLAGGIAHDFNNLLTVILGNINMGRRYTESNQKLNKFLRKAELACDQAQKLTSKLLTFSSGGAPVFETKSLDKLITDALEFSLSGSNIGFKIDLKENEDFVVAVDEGQLGQVFQNLIINSAQSMEHGGNISISLERASLSSGNSFDLMPGPYSLITIKDEGHGISLDNQKRIFDPYYTTKESGSGLGLATAYSIIKNHNGSLFLKESSELGSTFCIYLPLAEVKENRKFSGFSKAFKGRALIMDDEEGIRDYITDLLEEENYEVKAVKNGHEAIDSYEKSLSENNPFDFVILDLTIPGSLGGAETLSGLKKINPDVQAIVVSGYSHDKLMSNFNEHGFSGLVKKPFKADALMKVVHTVSGTKSRVAS